MKKRLHSFFLLVMLLSRTVFSQDGNLNDDYNRAVGFLPENLKVFNLYVQPNWLPDSSGLWYVNHSGGNKKYLKISFPDLFKFDLFDHEKLAAVLSDSLGEEIKANDLPLAKIEYKNAKELLIEAKGKKYLLNTETYSLQTSKADKESDKTEEPSPDKKWIVFSKDYNLFIKSAETGQIKQLSFSGEKGYEFATWYDWADIMEGENGERPKHFGVEWSKNSEWIYANICDLRTAQKMYLLNWSVDSLYRPTLLSYYRGSPGDTAMVYVEPVFFNIKTGKEIRTGLPESTHINPISVQWSDKPGIVYLSRLNRGFQKFGLYKFDLQTEKLDTLYVESSKTNIDGFDYRFAEKSGLLFFLSEKSGWRQLYRLNLETLKEGPVTEEEFYINSIDRIDEKSQRIFFRASGKDKDRNPYFQHLYRVSFDGEDFKLLTPEDRHHIISISPDGRYFADNYSTVDIPTNTVLRRTNSGKIVAELSRANMTALKEWQPPQVFTVVAYDGCTTIYGALWKPTHFDPDKKYPVIDNSYTGPHTHMFPEDFSAAFRNQSLAEFGFIVLCIDGLGTSGRSKEFHNYSYKNLGGGLKDHVNAIRQLAGCYNWIDTTRVGIFGHSAGGYDACHALLAYPNFYKVAVASSADHDHRMEKAWWPEMYMGWPVDSAYHQQSNITMAGNLKGKLLITHGGIDENVNPSATFKLAEALISAGKQFDMLILPSQHHGYRDKFGKYFLKLRWNYFIKHLLGKEPVWDFEWE